MFGVKLISFEFDFSLSGGWALAQDDVAGYGTGSFGEGFGCVQSVLKVH